MLSCGDDADFVKDKVLMKTRYYQVSSMQPGGVVDKNSGLWTRRREFESLPGYHPLELILY